MSTAEDLNDDLQQSPTRATAEALCNEARLQTLRDVADLNYLDTTGNRERLTARIVDDIFRTA